MAFLPFSSLNSQTHHHSIPFPDAPPLSRLSPSRPTTTHFIPTFTSLSKPITRTTIPILRSVGEQSAASATADATENSATSPATPLDMEVCFLDPETPPASIKEWELDFCSRPILDIRCKKMWEFIVCDGTLSLQFAKFFPNNVINSVTLKEAILSITEALGVPLPERVRFFRSQMQTIITKACTELGIKPVPSKRCISLLILLEERYETVYSCHPGFQKESKPLLALDKPFPMDLPENLFGEKWAFVQLPFSAVKQEISVLQTEFAFVGSLDLDLVGIDIEESTLIPGLAVASSRAQPLAAWMNGLELSSVEADVSRGCLILSAGVSTRYTYATYRKTAAATQEAESWEAAKMACGGLHFLAIQEDLDSDNCVGFWLLLDLPPPPV